MTVKSNGYGWMLLLYMLSVTSIATGQTGGMSITNGTLIATCTGQAPQPNSISAGKKRGFPFSTLFQ